MVIIMRRSISFLQDVLGLDVELVGQIGDRHALGERDRAGDRRRRSRSCGIDRTRGAPHRGRGPADPARGRRIAAAAADSAAASARARRPVCGRTGCDGSGRGPPTGGRGAAGETDGRCGRTPGARRAGWPPRTRCAGRGRLGLPVGCCRRVGGAGGAHEHADGAAARGGAWPVRGSSTRRRSVGGTMRPGGGDAPDAAAPVARPPARDGSLEAGAGGAAGSR